MPASLANVIPQYVLFEEIRPAHGTVMRRFASDVKLRDVLVGLLRGRERLTAHQARRHVVPSLYEVGNGQAEVRVLVRAMTGVVLHWKRDYELYINS